MYDYVLTLPSEVTLMWKSKPTGAMILFLVNRYSFIVDWIFNVVSSIIETRDIKVRMLCFHPEFYCR